MAYVRRDPFAREELHLERQYGSNYCSWCGCGRRTPKGREYLYAYRIESDGGRVSHLKGLFCGVSCMEAYCNA